MFDIVRIIAEEITIDPIKIKEKVPGGSAGSETLSNILNLVYAIMGIVAVVFIVQGGFTWIMSQGDPQKLAKGRNAFIFAVIGLLVVLVAASITNYVIGASTMGGGLIVNGGF